MMSRHFQPGRRQRTEPTAAAVELLTGDYPEAVKKAVFLASKGAVRGRRTCLLCARTGAYTRVFVPREALRLGAPDTSQVCSYWVCAVHSSATIPDAEVAQLLAARRAGSPRRRRRGRG
jgi:hypothetical protein